GGRLTALAVSGHSTGVGARSVSAINPRVIVSQLDLYGRNADGTKAELNALAFTRGEQLVELVSRDLTDGDVNFYVAAFRQACNEAEEGCGPADLLTPDIERNWTELSVYDELDVTNTVIDCAPCHQPSGPGTRKLLRMQEIAAPWTHWFSDDTEGGLALLDDYVAAKAD